MEGQEQVLVLIPKQLFIIIKELYQLKFSLIMATYGRRDEIVDLLISLEKQTYKNFDLIVVDQNEEPISDLFQDGLYSFKINYIHTEVKGASKARNIGLNIAKNDPEIDVITFPDDDCVYEEKVLEDVKRIFEEIDNIGFISTETTNIEGTGSLVNSPTENMFLTSKYGFISPMITLFFKQNFIADVNSFNEELGVGAGTIYGAGEETDFVLRGLRSGHRGYFVKDIVVYHPLKEDIIDASALQRALSYSGGFGKIIRLHYGFPYFLRAIAAATFRMLQNITNDKRKFHFNRLRGIIKGYFK